MSIHRRNHAAGRVGRTLLLLMFGWEIGVILLSPAAAVEPPTATAIPAPAPREWQWQPDEVAAIAKDLGKVQKKTDGTCEFQGRQWIVRTYHTPHFTVQVSHYMEMFAAAFQKAFAFRTTSDLQRFEPVMTVYPDEQSFLQATGKQSGFRGLFHYHIESVPGKIRSADLLLSTFYQTDDAEPNFGSQAPLSTIQHEATHCLLKRMFGTARTPKWLSEGIACYFESWDMRQELTGNDAAPADVQARTTRRGRSWRVAQLQYHYRPNSSQAPPRLADLIALDSSRTWNADNMGPQTVLHYCLAESLIDYLMESEKRRQFLYAILKRAHDKQKPLLTPEEQTGCEKGWLLFLRDKWGIKSSTP